MSGVELRDAGTTATYAPRVKRGSCRLSDGRAVIVVPDTNRSTANGDDVTGVAKIYIYISDTVDRTSYTLLRTHTPAVAMASSTRYAVMSATVRETNELYVIYQGTDNSLRFISFGWTGSTYNAGAEQTIVSAGAITNRFRCVDIDAIQPSSNPVVIAYEANAATGQGAHIRVYARMDDDTTWRRFYTTTIMTTDFIRTDSEDVSIACNKAGKSSNVIQIALYWTDTPSNHDHGDVIREISFNINSGAADSATVVGTWKSDLYKFTAAGSRRGMLFSEANNVWIFGAVVGSSVPFFTAIRLYHNVFTGLVHNTTATGVTLARNAHIVIERLSSPANAVSFEYCDKRMVFGFAGRGILSSTSTRMMVIRMNDDTANPNATRIDNASRMMHNGFALHNTGAIGVYGGANKNSASNHETFTFMVFYGATGDGVSSTPGLVAREFHAVGEDTISAPIILAPVNTTVTTDRPTIRVQAQNANLYSNVLGKLQLEIASNSGFSTNLQTITQGDEYFNSYSATSGTVPPIRTLIHTIESGNSLFTGTWYVRARVIDDLGGESAWSSTESFVISHPPVASPVGPANGSSSLYGTGDAVFQWNFTDPEQFDSQSARRLVIIRTDTGATVHDSGKVVTSLQSATVTGISSGLKDIPLQWSVSLWDSDDTQGPFSTGYVFTLVDPPTVVVTGPVEASTINTALPTVTWTFTVGGSRFQRAYRVRVWDTDASPDTEVADTGWVFSDAVTHSFVENILEEGINYRADVYVLDNLNLGDDDSNAFLTDWLPPVGIDLAVAVDEFKATLTWDNSDNDTDWVAYRVYRRYMKVAIPELDVENTATTWELVGEITDALTNYTFQDYTLPLNREVEYVVVQVADRFGSLLESDIGAVDAVTSVGDRYYFVPEVPVGTIGSFEASYVVGDAFTRDVEQNTLHVIGRGRQVQVGDDLGYSGTLTIHLRNPASARVDREFLEYLSTNQAGNVYIRSPFGDVLYVSFGNINSTRLAGVGTEDLVDLTIPYTTVYGEVSLTRAGS